MTATTVNVKSQSATYQSNSLGRKFQNAIAADAPVFVKTFYYKNTTGAALADGTVIDFGPILGPGIILPSSYVQSTALGASRLLDLGLQEYTSQLDGSIIAADLNTLIDNLDVSVAIQKHLGFGTSDTTIQGVEIFGAVNLLGTVAGGTIPANAEISGTLLIVKPL